MRTGDESISSSRWPEPTPFSCRCITSAWRPSLAATRSSRNSPFWSMFKGPMANDNPWEATTLEWTTATPPPHDNFGGRTPVVYHGPYEYSVPGAPKDYVMQNDPSTVTTH